MASASGGQRAVKRLRHATSMADAVAYVRRSIANRSFPPGMQLSVRLLARQTPCSRQTAMLALQKLRDTDVVRVDGDGNGSYVYVIRDVDVVVSARARELDELVGRDLRRLYDDGFGMDEIRESYRRVLPKSFGAD